MDSPCYVAAMRILNHRFNSEAELRRKLKGKRKFEPEDIDAAIARLREERWLDDERFAGAFVRTRLNKRVGPERIVRELQNAGIASREAQSAVDANADPEREATSLAALCRKRIEIVARRHGRDYLETREGLTKIVSWLVSRGYSADSAWQTARELVRTE